MDITFQELISVLRHVEGAQTLDGNGIMIEYIIPTIQDDGMVKYATRGKNGVIAIAKPTDTVRVTFKDYYQDIANLQERASDLEEWLDLHA